MEKNIIPRAFLIVLIIAIIYACYRVFQPFITIIIAATIITTIFYSLYEKLVVYLKNRRNLAALIMCILIALVVIIPVANFLVYTAQRSVQAYDTTIKYLSDKNISEAISNNFWEKYNFIGISGVTIKDTVLGMAKGMNDWLVSGAGNLIKSTTGFIFSLFMIFFTMFFFFVDGKHMLAKLMQWTPLPNKYDREIFKKFHDISKSIIVSTFATALAQGFIGGIGFMIVGLPAFFAGIAIAFFSLLPYIGASIVWVPASIYLLATGKIWQGIFLLVWGMSMVSLIDNLIRAYLIKGKAQVHPIFIIFSILGGISLFGFWGIIFGPLIISLAITILHIYETEYQNILEK